MNQIGMIQGRLSPRPYPKLQAFPAATWKKEFPLAKEIGCGYIEWIFEADGYEENPLWTQSGRKEIRDMVTSTQMPVASVCADYFLERPFYRENGYTFRENVQILQRLIRYSREVGAGKILLPVLETAELRTDREEDILVSALEECVPLLEENQVYLGLETELPADQYKKLCQRVRSPYVGAYYDTGNTAACGYDMAEDMDILGSELICVHVKDRKLHGESTCLGGGAANLSGGISVLRRQGYQGGFTLQSYFGDSYLEDARKNLLYMKALLEE